MLGWKSKIRIVGIAPDSFVGGVYDPKEHIGDEVRYGGVVLCPNQILVEPLGKERACALGWCKCDMCIRLAKLGKSICLPVQKWVSTFWRFWQV